MLAALDSLPSNQDRINFLLEKGYLDEALPIMKKEGKNYLGDSSLMMQSWYT